MRAKDNVRHTIADFAVISTGAVICHFSILSYQLGFYLSHSAIEFKVFLARGCCPFI